MLPPKIGEGVDGSSAGGLKAPCCSLSEGSLFGFCAVSPLAFVVATIWRLMLWTCALCGICSCCPLKLLLLRTLVQGAQADCPTS